MSDITESNIAPTLRRRKLPIFLSGLAAACLALGITKILPDKFVSIGSMIVEPAASSISGHEMDSANDDRYVLTQSDILRSRELIAPVVAKLQLTSDRGGGPLSYLASLVRHTNIVKTYFPALWALLVSLRTSHISEFDQVNNTIEYVQQNLKINVADHSNVISIQFQATTPQRARAVVSALMEQYLYAEISQRQKQTAQLASRISTLKTAVDTADLQVQRFIRDHNQPEVQGSLITAIQLSKDQGQLAADRQDLSHWSAVLESVGQGDGAGLQEVLESATIRSYKEQKAQVIKAIAQLSPSDVRREQLQYQQQLQYQLDAINTQIANETGSIVASIKRKVAVAQAAVRAGQITVAADAASAQISASEQALLGMLKAGAASNQQIYTDVANRAEQTLLAADQTSPARVLSSAALLPHNSLTLIALLFGFTGGLLLSIAFIILRASYDTKISSTVRISEATGLPVIGSLPEIKKGRRRLLLTSATANSMITETLRAICLTMISEARQGEGTTIIITSSEGDEGKTTVAAMLACRFAIDGYSVLLIDADLRRPSLAAALHMTPAGSLMAVLSGSMPLREAVVRNSVGVDCLLGDGQVLMPMGIMTSKAFKALLTEGKSAYDFVILDSPPVLQVADAVLLASFCQRIFFIVGSGRVTGELVTEAVRRFRETDRFKMAALLTRAPLTSLTRRDYFSGYKVALRDMRGA